MFTKQQDLAHIAVCSPCWELLAPLALLQERVFYYILPENQHSASFVLVPLGWHRAAVAGSVLPWKQFTT